MDKRKALLNVSVSIGFKLIAMALVIVVKRILIQTCGNEVNGLNALYLSIIGTLSVAELGVGTAISFCMYKPIVEGDINIVASLYHLLRRLYLVIGGFLFVCGLLITPFITVLAKDYEKVDVNLYLTFIIMLVSVELTYVYSSKISLINAYKNNYITTAISSGGLLLQYVLQIIVLLTTKSYVGYLICRIVTAVVQWIVTEIVIRYKYKFISSNYQKIDSKTKAEVIKNVKAMFMHRIGGVLVNTVDSVVISSFVGVIALGEYSNYATILSAMSGVLTLVFSSLTSVVGHLCVTAKKSVIKQYFEAFQLLNFVLGTVFFMGYFAVIDNIISILFSAELVVVRDMSLVIALNGFVQFMRKNILMFKDATGTFYNDRWRPLAEGATNILLSIIFVKFFGAGGVIVATIITNLLICDTIEPYVFYKNALNNAPKRFYFMNYSMIGIFTFGLCIMRFSMQNISTQWGELFVNGCISIVISIVLCLVAVLLNWNSFKNTIIELKGRYNKCNR